MGVTVDCLRRGGITAERYECAFKLLPLELTAHAPSHIPAFLSGGHNDMSATLIHCSSHEIESPLALSRIPFHQLLAEVTHEIVVRRLRLRTTKIAHHVLHPISKAGAR